MKCLGVAVLIPEMKGRWSVIRQNSRVRPWRQVWCWRWCVMPEMQKRRDLVGTAMKTRQVCSSIITLWGLVRWQWMGSGKPGPAGILLLYFQCFLSLSASKRSLTASTHPCGALKSVEAHCAHCRCFITGAVITSLQTPPLVFWCSCFPHSAQTEWAESKTLGSVCVQALVMESHVPSFSQARGKKVFWAALQHFFTMCCFAWHWILAF